MSDVADWIGRSVERLDRVSPDLIARFHASLNLEPADDPPPGFHWCLCPPETATTELGEDGHPAKGDFLPPIDLPRRMWAASELDFLVPILPGAQINQKSTISAITEKQGKSGSLVFVDFRHETSVDGRLAIREKQTLVYREADAKSPGLPAKGGSDLSSWSIQKTVIPTPQLLFRYSALTFNTHRIHYDFPYATEAEGYPGLVVHGPLIATWLMNLAMEHLDSRNLRQFSFRALSPAFANQPIHLCSEQIDTGQLKLVAIDDAGQILMESLAS